MWYCLEFCGQYISGQLTWCYLLEKSDCHLAIWLKGENKHFILMGTNVSACLFKHTGTCVRQWYLLKAACSRTDCRIHSVPVCDLFFF